MVQLLKRVATLLETADGYITCEYSDDEIDEQPLGTHFEFYSVADGRLYRQEGRIVAGPEEPA